MLEDLAYFRGQFKLPESRPHLLQVHSLVVYDPHVIFKDPEQSGRQVFLGFLKHGLYLTWQLIQTGWLFVLNYSFNFKF